MLSDPFDRISHLFGNFDAAFRDLEQSLGMGNLLPYVTVPSVKTKYLEQRCVEDKEKRTYYHNGLVSRLDGPAIEWKDEKKEDEWYVDGVRLTKEEVEAKKQEIEDAATHHLTIDGKHMEVTGKQLRELKKMLGS